MISSFLSRRKRPAVVAAVVLVAGSLALSACGADRVVPGDTHTITVTASAPSKAKSASASSTAPKPSTSTSTSSKPKKPSRPKKVVKVSSLLSDGETYGIGMPIVLFFTPVPTNSKAFTDAVKVTVNGKQADGAWFWEQPLASEVQSHTMEAHYRLQGYWPAHSLVKVKIPIGGLSAGRGKVYSNALTSLTFHIGAAHVSTVDANTLTMTTISDGKVVKTIPVSLGAAATPTYNGTKVVMQKGENIPGTDELRPDGTVLMSGPTYTDDPVMWSVRMTQSGEYIHAAPWNSEIGQRSTSNGCTNLQVAAAYWFYHFAQIGDVVNYIHTDGSKMPPLDGLGDWNISWAQWKQGGQLLNH